MPYFGVPFGFVHNRQPKWAVGVPAVWDEKRHFQPADYDLLEKERLAARKFGHVRHNVYKNVLEPPPTSLSYASEDERLQKDVEATVKLDYHNTQARKKEILESSTNRREQRDKRAWMDRESEWERHLEHEAWTRNEHPHARVIANRTSVPYDPITLQYHDGYEGERAKYIDASARWRAAMRAIRINQKMNGNKNYDVISWARLPILAHPEKPTPPKFPCNAENKSHGQIVQSGVSMCKDTLAQYD